MSFTTPRVHCVFRSSADCRAHRVFFWRSETLGSYGLVFNTIMHYRNLSSGGEPPLTDDE